MDRIAFRNSLVADRDETLAMLIDSYFEGLIGLYHIIEGVLSQIVVMYNLVIFFVSIEDPLVDVNYLFDLPARTLDLFISAIQFVNHLRVENVVLL